MLVNIFFLILLVSFRFGEIRNILLLVILVIVNGEIGFFSNFLIILYEFKDFFVEVVSTFFLFICRNVFKNRKILI